MAKQPVEAEFPDVPDFTDTAAVNVNLRAPITNLAVKLGERMYKGDVDSELAFTTDPEGLNKALAENPGKFAWWAMLEVHAKAQLEELDSRRNLMKAELYGRYENLLTTDVGGKEKRPTVAAIEAAVQEDESYQKLVARVQAARKDYDVLTVMRQAIVQRKDVLLAIASNYRAELDAHLHDQLRAVRENIAARKTS